MGITMSDHATGGTKRDWLAFDGADYLALKIVLGIVVIGSILFGLGGPVVAAATNSPLPVSYTAKVTSGIELPRGATLDGEPTVKLLLSDAALGERLTQALPDLLIAAMTVAVAWLLFQLLRDTQAQEPFTRRNVRRINMIALVIGLGGVLVQFALGIADNAIQTSGRIPDQGDPSFVFTFAPLPLVAGIVIALIGEAFRRGVQLRDDVEGLV
jgi:hypothetical protein